MTQNINRALPVKSFNIRSRGGPVFIRFFTWDESIRSFVPWGYGSDMEVTLLGPGIIPSTGGGPQGSQVQGTLFSRDEGDFRITDKEKLQSTLAQNFQKFINDEGQTETPKPTVPLEERGYNVVPLPPGADPRTLSVAYPPGSGGGGEGGGGQGFDVDSTDVGSNWTDTGRGLSLQNSRYWDLPPTEGFDWSSPWGWRLFYTGHKLDDMTTHNPDPGAGNMGISDEGPWIGGWWRYGDEMASIPRPNELYLAVQIPEFTHPWYFYPEGQTHHGIPSSYWDVAGMIGYRYHGQLDPAQSLHWSWGLGTYFQWTNDVLASGGSHAQTNPSGRSLGPQHFIPFMEIISHWDGWAFGDHATSWEITWQVDYHGSSRIYGGVNL